MVHDVRQPGDSPPISVIVPAYNNSVELRECLAALAAKPGPAPEIIVVDDGSTDDTGAVATECGGTILLRLERNSGPAAARNRGARVARGGILLFVDADVVVAPNALARVEGAFSKDPDLGAVFGSYDAWPRVTTVVSRYRNLLHHFVHQNGKSDATTFWAGLGAVRREVFEAIGGFDENRYRRASIEDIELGYRLRQAGYRILLDKKLQAKHLKRWTLASVIRTDVGRRALPWSRLILESQVAPNDLNLRREQRWSVALSGLSLALLLLSPIEPRVLLPVAMALAAVIVLNRDLFGFLARQHGAGFAVACVPLHLLYFLSSGLGYALALAGWLLGRGWLRRQSKPEAAS